MAILVAVVLLAGGAVVAVAAGSSKSSVTTIRVIRGKSLGETEIRAQMTACERLVAKRAALPRRASTNFIVDVLSGVIDKISPGLGLLGDTDSAKKRGMEGQFWSVYKTILGEYLTKYMQEWWKSWKNFWTGLLRKIGVISGDPDADDPRYSTEWIARAETALGRSLELGVPAFQGYGQLNDPRAYTESTAPVPKWVAEEIEHQIARFESVSVDDRAVLRDFWLRAFKLRDGAARVLFAGIGSLKECPQLECSETVAGVRRGCHVYEWETCAASVQPIFDAQSLTYTLAHIYASSYGTRVSSAQWYALEDESKLFWKVNGPYSHIEPARLFGADKSYHDERFRIELYVTAPYNLPIETFVRLLRISSAAAKRAPIERPVKLAPLSMP